MQCIHPCCSSFVKVTCKICRVLLARNLVYLLPEILTRNLFYLLSGSGTNHYTQKKEKTKNEQDKKTKKYLSEVDIGMYFGICLGNAYRTRIFVFSLLAKD